MLHTLGVGFIVALGLFCVWAVLMLVHLMGITVVEELGRDSILEPVLDRLGYKASLVEVYPDGVRSNLIGLVAGLVVVALAVAVVFLLGVAAGALGLR